MRGLRVFRTSIQGWQIWDRTHGKVMPSGQALEGQVIYL